MNKFIHDIDNWDVWGRAVSVAAHFGFTYRQHEEDGMRECLRMVKENVL